MNKVVDLRGASTELVHQGTPAVQGAKRSPWSGGLSEQELARPGGMLLAALYQCAAERGELLQDMAKELGVTYGYLSQLRNGIRQIHTIGDEFAAACAQYLCLNRFQVLMMAGRLTPADLWADPKVFEREVRQGMTTLARDPEFRELLTHQLLNETNLESQYALIKFYEKATGRVLLKKGVECEKVAKDVKAVQDFQKTQKA